MNNKLETISNLFEGNEIRSIWDSEKEDYYFSVIDVINALADSKNPNDYWDIKARLNGIVDRFNLIDFWKEGNQYGS